MSAPEFWDHAEGPKAAPLRRALLSPLSWAYQFGAGVRSATSHAGRVGTPVICVGNVSVGGVGKTPTAIAVIERLRQRGVTAHAVSRGYGGRKQGPVQVDPDVHESRDVGDEALLLARAGPTWVAKNKLAGARAAARQGAQAVVLDDGFQNPTIAKDLSLVLIDDAAGVGNGRVVPAGPLRESPSAAMRRADAIVVVSGVNAPDSDSAWRRHVPQDKPVLNVRLTPSGPIPLGAVYAFAGIGRPQKFFDALRRAGAELQATQPFPDHHPYTGGELHALRDAARRHNALLLTTEKDHVRLPKDMRRLIHAWPITAEFEDEAALDALVDAALDRAAARR